MIKSLELTSIDAKRFTGPRAKKVRVDLNGAITNVEAEDGDARVSFRYTTNYGTLGRIDIEGRLRYSGENGDKLVESWKESQRLDEKIAQQLYSAIMAACVSEAVIIARDLRLPPPIPLPPLPKTKFQHERKERGPEFG